MIKKIIILILFPLLLTDCLAASSQTPTPFSFPSLREYLSANQRYILGAIALIGSIATYKYFKKHETQHLPEELKQEQLEQLKMEQSVKLSSLLSTISDAPLTLLYQGDQHPVCINDSNLLSPQTTPDELKKIFETYRLVTGQTLMEIPIITNPWAEEEWSEALAILQDRDHTPANHQLDVKALEALLRDAQSIIKSFLPDTKIDQIRTQFIQKSDIYRLFTYVKLHKVIQEKELSHIHLPLKILVIKDKKTGTFLTSQAASEVLDTMIKIFVTTPSHGVTAKINHLSSMFTGDNDDYELLIFAHKQKKGGVPLSQAALHELAELVKVAPFDVGYDNIFSDDKGDAVIIDTEFKGEPIEHSLAKLVRYKKTGAITQLP